MTAWRRDAGRPPLQPSSVPERERQHMAGGAKAERTVSDGITLAQNLDSLAVCFQSLPQSSMNEDGHPSAVYWESSYCGQTWLALDKL